MAYPAEEEGDPEHLRAIVEFCRRNHWHYLFNNEVGNYRRGDNKFKHADGTYRYDLAERTLATLKDDPLFLGVVYDEGDLMQTLEGVADPTGKKIEPYLADTRSLSAAQSYTAVVEKVSALSGYYDAYGKRLIFEMTFPDYPFAFAKGGALLAPKLLKENFNDLMYAVYRGCGPGIQLEGTMGLYRSLVSGQVSRSRAPLTETITLPISCCRRSSSPIPLGLTTYMSNR